MTLVTIPKLTRWYEISTNLELATIRSHILHGFWNRPSKGISDFSTYLYTYPPTYPTMYVSHVDGCNIHLLRKKFINKGHTKKLLKPTTKYVSLKTLWSIRLMHMCNMPRTTYEGVDQGCNGPKMAHVQSNVNTHQSRFEYF